MLQKVILCPTYFGECVEIRRRVTEMRSLTFFPFGGIKTLAVAVSVSKIHVSVAGISGRSRKACYFLFEGISGWFSIILKQLVHFYVLLFTNQRDIHIVHVVYTPFNTRANTFWFDQILFNCVDLEMTFLKGRVLKAKSTNETRFNSVSERPLKYKSWNTESNFKML